MKRLAALLSLTLLTLACHDGRSPEPAVNDDFGGERGNLPYRCPLVSVIGAGFHVVDGGA